MRFTYGYAPPNLSGLIRCTLLSMLDQRRGQDKWLVGRFWAQGSSHAARNQVLERAKVIRINPNPDVIAFYLGKASARHRPITVPALRERKTLARGNFGAWWRMKSDRTDSLLGGS